MKNYLYGIFGLFLLTLVACDKDDPIPNPPEKGTECTVLAYLIGNSSSNDLSNLLRNNYNDMLIGMGSVDVSKYNLLVYLESKYDESPYLVHVRKDETNKVIADTLYSYPVQNPLNISVMTEVFSKVFSDFPADRYGLVLGSHADGWIPATQSASRSFGEYLGTQMDIPDFATVLQRVGKHFDYIFFDACFMQTVEVAYELRNYADYIVASPTEIPGPGAPFQTLTPMLFKTDRAALAIAEEYYRVYADTYTGVTPTTSVWTGGVSVTAIDTRYLEQLAVRTKDILSGYYRQGQWLTSLSGIMCYDNRNVKYYYDFDGFIRLITSEDNNYLTWKKTYDQAVTYFATTPKNYSAYARMFDMEGATGLSTYIPQNQNSLAYTYYPVMQWYSAAGWEDTGGWPDKE